MIQRGILRSLGRPPKQKLAITPDILKKIFGTLHMNQPLHRVFWSACITAFHAFLRKSTLLPKSTKPKHTNKSLCLGDVVLSPDGHFFLLTIRHSKTIQFGQRILTLLIKEVRDSPLCPVKALCKVLAPLERVKLSQVQPLFTFTTDSGKIAFLTHSLFVKLLKASLMSAGLDPSEYSGHSFRRGGCSYAFEIGFPNDLIKLRGDWKSNAYERYVTVSMKQHKMFASRFRKSLCHPPV